jgi:hypothetical protein
MTSMLHRHDHGDPSEHKLQLAQLDLVASSQSQVLAENDVGMLERVMVSA